MQKLLDLKHYTESIAATRDNRMAWWRDARLGMFIHFGLYSVMGHMEWAITRESMPPEEYLQYAKGFLPKPGAPWEWARLAKEAGMKYMVLTTRHHEGFSLWDSKVNPFNSVNYGPKRDIVREFVDACRAFDLKIGFYSSLMDWHHPDAYRCTYDSEARNRFLAYIEALNTELLTNYGKIDILWYDVAEPFKSWEGWDALARNQRLRALQPHIIINNRCRMEEDFGTPEGQVTPEERDWEACITVNGLSWGYVDEVQAEPYALSVPRILRMVQTCTKKGGNLLLNIGPRPDGSVPDTEAKILRQLGEWTKRNGEVIYGQKPRTALKGTNIAEVTLANEGKTLYFWHWVWPRDGKICYAGYPLPKKATILATGQTLQCSADARRLILQGLPQDCPDPNGVAIIKVEYDQPPQYGGQVYYPQHWHEPDAPLLP